MINPPLWSKMIATAVCSIVAVVLYLLNRKSKARLLCMIAMLLCSVGDVFMTNIFKINDMITTIIGASAFIAGHLFYANMFYYLLKKKEGKFFNVGFYVGLVVGFLPLIVMEVISIATVKEPPVLYLVAVPVYVAVITLHIASNFAYGYVEKSWKSIVLAVAVTVFYITDILIFLYMFGIAPREVEFPIWHFYPLAQLLLIVFSSPIRKRD